jgi:hypothetical protein
VIASAERLHERAVRLRLETSPERLADGAYCVLLTPSEAAQLAGSLAAALPAATTPAPRPSGRYAPRVGLTHKQAACLTVIRTRVTADGIAPTYEEPMAELGLRSKSGVHRLVTGLAERGHITRLAGHGRSIQLVEEARL